MKKLLTFVMAGGKGERLAPLTKDRAKPAVPFGGIYRIIDFTLSNCINSGMRRIHILVQYKSMSLSRHIRMGWNILNAEVGEYIDVVPAQQRVDEHWYQGTADAIYQNLYSIDIENPDQVLILAGDHVYKMNYQPMLDQHRASKADLTIGVVPMPVEEAPYVGVIQTDDSGVVVGFEEKPAQPKTIPGDPAHVYGSMGIYIFDRKVLEEELTEDAKKDTEHDFGKNVIPQMIKNGKRKIVSYNFVDAQAKEAMYWRDVGTLDGYYEANIDLVNVTPQFNLYDRDWPIRTHQLQYPPAKFVFNNQLTGGRRGEALDSLVADGCIISGGSVRRCILSPNVRVNSYAEVENSLLLESVEVSRYAKVKNAIIDKHVKIMPGATVGHDPELDKKRFIVTPKGIVVVEKGAVVEAV